MGIVEIVVIVVNVLAFVIMGIDKYKAKKGLWRIPEKNIFTLAFLFGALGVLLGMKVFHHKTKHKMFTVGIPLIFILNILCYYYVKVY